MKWRRERAEPPATDEETEASMARESAEQNLQETRERWSEIGGLAELVKEVNSGRNGVSFLQDMAEAMRPRPPRKRKS